MSYVNEIKNLLNNLDMEFQDLFYNAMIETFDNAKDLIIKTKEELKSNADKKYIVNKGSPQTGSQNEGENQNNINTQNENKDSDLKGKGSAYSKNEIKDVPIPRYNNNIKWDQLAIYGLYKVKKGDIDEILKYLKANCSDNHRVNNKSAKTSLTNVLNLLYKDGKGPLYREIKKDAGKTLVYSFRENVNFIL